MPKRITIKRDPRHARRKRLYGIAEEAYSQMLQAQEFKCAICKKEKPLVVDHWHSGDKAVRGGLCFACNCALGLFGENVAIMESAIAYLKHHWGLYHARVSAADALLDEELW